LDIPCAIGVVEHLLTEVLQKELLATLRTQFTQIVQSGT